MQIHMKKFRLYHLIQILSKFEEEGGPLDGFLRRYFREHKAVGSKDRQEICAVLYGIVRWRGLLDYLCSKPLSWEKRIQKYLEIKPETFKNDAKIPPHVRVSFPQYLYSRLKEHYGEKKATSICLNSNDTAPLTIRANLLKTSREALLKTLGTNHNVSPCKSSESGITLEKKLNFFSLKEFKEGLFEVQDEGSQLVANQVAPEGRAHVLDYCAGAGGKTLAFAHKMGNQGQIYLYDIRPHILEQAKKRLKRAGIQNAQILCKKKLKKKGYLGRMDWLLLDVPCSGTGTLRRNPDMKWKINDSLISRLCLEQREIFEESLKFLHPNGKIVYATCSILPEENEEQVSFFLKKYDLKLTQPPFLSFPTPSGMDGFFCAVLTR